MVFLLVTKIFRPDYLYYSKPTLVTNSQKPLSYQDSSKNCQELVVLKDQSYREGGCCTYVTAAAGSTASSWFHLSEPKSIRGTATCGIHSFYKAFFPQVLQIDPDTDIDVAKKKFKKLSLLIHPDKNPDDRERADQAFDSKFKEKLMVFVIRSSDLFFSFCPLHVSHLNSPFSSHQEGNEANRKSARAQSL